MRAAGEEGFHGHGAAGETEGGRVAPEMRRDRGRPGIALSPALRGAPWVRPPGSRPAASEGPTSPRRNSRPITKPGGAESSARPPLAPPLARAPPTGRSVEAGLEGMGQRYGLSQWQCGRCTKKPIGSGPGAGPGGSGDSSRIAKGAGCWGRRGPPRFRRKGRKGAESETGTPFFFKKKTDQPCSPEQVPSSLWDSVFRSG